MDVLRIGLLRACRYVIAVRRTNFVTCARLLTHVVRAEAGYDGRPCLYQRRLSERSTLPRSVAMPWTSILYCASV